MKIHEGFLESEIKNGKKTKETTLTLEFNFMKQHKNINQEAARIFLKTVYQHNIQLLKILLSSTINCCFTNIVSLDRVQS